MTSVAGEPAQVPARPAPGSANPISPVAALRRESAALSASVVLVPAFLLLALLYAWAVPPFESPDENSHFEYARLMAELGRRPLPADRSPELRREVEGYMLARGYGLLLPAGDGERRLGFNDELGRQPPTYYVLPALLAWLAPDRPEQEVRAMRLASIALGTLVVLSAVAAARELFPEDPFARVALPTIVATTPGFAFIAASVNNDNMANLGGAVAFWGLARAYRRGLSPAAVGLLVGGVLIGLSGKRTALGVAVAALIGLYLVGVLRLRWHGAARAALALAPLLLGAVALPQLFQEGRRAVGWQIEHPGPSRVADSLFGEAALRVAPGPNGEPGRLRQFLSAADVERAGASGLSAAAWVRADADIAVGAPATLRFALVQGERTASTDVPVDHLWRPVRVAFKPEGGAPVMVVVQALPGGEALLVDGLVVAPGERAGLPELTGPVGATGLWDGRPFANLARNGSGEEADRELAAWAVPIADAVGANPTLLAATTDLRRLTSGDPAVVSYKLWFALQSYVGRFGWQVLPMSDLAYRAVVALLLAAGLGLAIRLVEAPWRGGSALAPMGLCALLGAGCLAAGILPFLSGALGNEWPQGRYLYPGIAALSGLVALGLSRLVPRRLVWTALALLVVGAITLNGAALLGTIIPRYAGAA